MHHTVVLRSISMILNFQVSSKDASPALAFLFYVLIAYPTGRLIARKCNSAES